MTKSVPNLVVDHNSKMFCARWYVDGKEKRKSLRTKDLRAAKKLLKEHMARINAVRHGGMVETAQTPRGPTWEQVVEDYHRHITYKRLDEKTQTRYTGDHKRIHAFLTEQNTGPCDAGIRHVSDLIGEMVDNELSMSSIRNCLTAWSRLIAPQIVLGTLKSNYVKEYERRQLDDEEWLILPPLNGEFERMLPDVQRLAADFLLLVEWLHRTGCRLSEALHATRENIFTNDRTRDVMIWLSNGTKRGKRRTINLNRAEELLDRLPKSGRLFPNFPLTPASVSSGWGRFWARRLAEAEARALAEDRRPLTDWELRRWRLHDLRHAFAINAMLEIDDPKGENLFALQGHLGHASVKMTEKYLRAMEQLPVSHQRGLRLNGGKERDRARRSAYLEAGLKLGRLAGHVTPDDVKAIITVAESD